MTSHSTSSRMISSQLRRSIAVSPSESAVRAISPAAASSPSHRVVIRFR
jgi:hypothetical protein